MTNQTKAKILARGTEFRTPECRLSFAQGLFKKNDRGKYAPSLIFAKTVDRSALDKALRDVIVEAWGDKGLEKAKAGLIKSPFLAGDGKEARSKKTGDLHPGMGPDVFFIRPTTTIEPVVRYKSANIPATEQEVYSGCYGFAVLQAFAWNNDESGDGVSFGVNYFQKLRDGDRLAGSGGTDANQWFESIEDTGAAPEETKSGQGAGGLFG